ncbi:MAG TPA: hypothetical protein VGD01_00140 [Candidatus Elarobacter sp.]
MIIRLLWSLAGSILGGMLLRRIGRRRGLYGRPRGFPAGSFFGPGSGLGYYGRPRMGGGGFLSGLLGGLGGAFLGNELFRGGQNSSGDAGGGDWGGVSGGGWGGNDDSGGGW